MKQVIKKNVKKGIGLGIGMTYLASQQLKQFASDIELSKNDVNQLVKNAQGHACKARQEIEKDVISLMKKKGYVAKTEADKLKKTVTDLEKQIKDYENLVTGFVAKAASKAKNKVRSKVAPTAKKKTTKKKTVKKKTTKKKAAKKTTKKRVVKKK